MCTIIFTDCFTAFSVVNQPRRMDTKIPNVLSADGGCSDSEESMEINAAAGAAYVKTKASNKGTLIC